MNFNRGEAFEVGETQKPSVKSYFHFIHTISKHKFHSILIEITTKFKSLVAIHAARKQNNRKNKRQIDKNRRNWRNNSLRRHPTGWTPRMSKRMTRKMKKMLRKAKKDRKSSLYFKNFFKKNLIFEFIVDGKKKDFLVLLEIKTLLK